MEKSNSTSLGLNTVINKALHIMAAHLHRYSSELERLEDIVCELLSRHEKSMSLIEMPSDDSSVALPQEWHRAKLGFEQIMSQLKAIRSFAKELESKITNILALVS